MRLRDKVIAITGGGAGIGQAIALRAAAEGAKIIIMDKDRDAGKTTLEALNALDGGEHHFVSGDVARSEDCRRLIDSTVKQYGRIDGLVNNAGCAMRAALTVTEEELFQAVFDVSIRGAFYCSRYAVDAMLCSRKGGALVHIGSLDAFGGGQDTAASACAKGALHTLSRHISRNYAQYGVRSNWITAGWVATEGEVRLHQGLGTSPAAFRRLAQEQIPAGQMQTVDDIAAGVIFLLSDDAAQITGTDLHITGGMVP